MGRKLLVSRAGAGSILVAVCAALPGCNLAAPFSRDCVGEPSSRGMSTIECPGDDADTRDDAAGDGATHMIDAPGADGAGGRR
jgi:hypothetical protein